MKIQKKFIVFCFFFFIDFIFWIITKDFFLLNIWIGVASIISISFLINKYSLTGIEINRYVKNKNQTVGNIFDERMEINNKSRLSKLWIELIDQSELFSNVHSRVITSIKPKNHVIFSSSVILNKRGLFALGPTTIKSGDPFGIFSISKTFPEKNYLVVFPKYYSLNYFPLITNRMIGNEYAYQKTAQTTPQAAGVREFQPGDPLNRIHWPITIKKNRLIVKEFDEDTQSSVWIFLDAKRGIYFRQKEFLNPTIDRNLLPIKQTYKYMLPRDSFEYAISIAAAITQYYIRKKMAVGFVSESYHTHIIPSEKSHRQFVKILETLSVLDDIGNLSISQIINKQVGNIHKGSAVIIITALVDEELRRTFVQIKRRGLKSILIYINNQSFSSDLMENNILLSDGDMLRISYGDDLEKKLSGR